MNKQRKTSHILNIFQYDADGHVVIPASLTLGIAPAGDDNSAKVPSTAWVRTYVASIGGVLGTGTTNYVSKFTASGSIGNSLIFDNGTTVLIGTTTAPTPVMGVSFPFSVTSSAATRIRIDSTQATPNAGVGLYANGVQKFSFAMFGATSDFTIYNDALLAASLLVKGNTNNILIGTSSDNSSKLRVNGTGWFDNTLTATSFVKNGGASTEILAADGSVITAGTGITISGGTISSTVTGGVTSFNTRTGAITLSSNDVTTALGFTPISSYTETDTLATVTSRGSSTTGAITISSGGDLNLRAISGSSDSGDIVFQDGSGAELHRLWGGSSTINYRTNAGTTYQLWHTGNLTNLNQLTNGPGYITGYTETDTLASVTGRGASTSTNVTFSGTGNQFSGHHYFLPWDSNGNHYPHYNVGASNNGSKLNLRMFGGNGSVTRVFFLNGNDGTISWDGNTILHAGNFNSYAPTLTGGGASGTWGIRITGFANQGTARLYSTDSSYNYDAANPYFGFLTYDGTRWLFQVSPGTPAAVRVAYADSAGSASSASNSTQWDGYSLPTWTNWSSRGSIAIVVGQLGWKNYGNNHVIFDASNSTSPTGSGVNNTNPDVAWTGTYPTLMGWNGSNTYGVRVDSARRADNVEGFGAASFYRNLGFGSGYPSWDLNTVDPDRSGFTYSNGAPYTGPFIHIGASGYGLQFNAPYGGDGYGLAFRTRNGDTGSWNNWKYPAVYGVNINGGGSLYATIYYDHNDTAYYVDPASGSRMNSITYDNLYFSGDTSYGFLGRNVYADTVNGRGSDPLELNYYDGGGVIIGAGGSKGLTAGTLTANGLIRVNGNTNLYLDYNYGQSIVGLYSSYRYQGVFAMGDAYKLAIDGTTAGNLYGIAWSHPNAGGVAGNLNNHGALVLINGAFAAAISSSIRAAADMRAPIFYDQNNTSYYIDPDGGSLLYSLVLSGATYFRPQTWIQLDGSYGLYWPNSYGAHFNPNTASSYTQLATQGSKNSYGGLYDYYSAVNGIMYDSGGNGGVYREANGRWYFYYHLSNDCMGIGTSSTSSTYSLYLNKGVYAQSRIDATIFYDTNNTAYYLDPNGGSYFAGSVEVANGYFLTNGIGGSMYMTSVSGSFGGYLRTSGHMVLDQMNTGYNVYVLDGNSVGVVKNASSQSWSAFSDRTIKTVHSVMVDNLSKLESITPIYYSFNNFADDKNRIGLIAQEVQEQFPELVELEPRTEKLTLDYTGLIPVLLGAIKELKNKVEDLESRL